MIFWVKNLLFRVFTGWLMLMLMLMHMRNDEKTHAFSDLSNSDVFLKPSVLFIITSYNPERQLSSFDEYYYNSSRAD